MLRLVWGAEALSDLRRIIDYIADRNIAAAQRLEEAIRHTAEHLPGHPYLYRPGRVADTREAVVHPNYIHVYRVGDDAVEVVAVAGHPGAIIGCTSNAACVCRRSAAHLRYTEDAMTFDLLSAIELTASSAAVITVVALATADTPGRRVRLAAGLVAWFVAVVALGASGALR